MYAGSCGLAVLQQIFNAFVVVRVQKKRLRYKKYNGEIVLAELGGTRNCVVVVVVVVVNVVVVVSVVNNNITLQ